MNKYILDTNFFIEAKNLHFPMEQHEEFWSWLSTLLLDERIEMVKEVYDELIKGGDNLAEWAKEHENCVIKLHEEDLPRLAHVMQKGYRDIDKMTLKILKADPYVICYAIVLEGCVVTSEKPRKIDRNEKPQNQPAPKNKKISDVCDVLGVPCFTLSRFLWELRATMPRERLTRRNIKRS